jgi:hypothetical protein
MVEKRMSAGTVMIRGDDGCFCELLLLLLLL